MLARSPSPRPRTALAIAVLAAALATVPVAAFSSGASATALASRVPAVAGTGPATISNTVAARPTTPPLRFTVADLATVRPVARPAAHGVAPVAKPAAAAKPAPRAPVYAGRNHVWIPSLGISRSVADFACTRSQPPGTAVYRWGCAGANNVYLFAHAYAAFAPLHDAYVSGRLTTRLTVVYADGAGRVHTYRVAWWRLTTPDNGAFAYAAQSRPSLTLQTCVGAQSQYRLIVRLVQVG